MSAKPVAPRAQARRDIELAVAHYLNEAGADVAFDFIDAVQQVYALIAEYPAAGSSRWSHELNLLGLREPLIKSIWLSCAGALPLFSSC